VAKTLREWLDADVAEVKDRSVGWLSQHHFFRDPIRPIYCEPTYFFSPADGIILYQETVAPDERIVDVKGKAYSLREAMRDDHFDQTCCVIGIFMTFYDVHINRVPYSGRLSYKLLDPIDTYNYPMLDVEKGLLEDLRVNTSTATYLHNNQRVLNRVYAPNLRQSYYILQIADYDVDSITPFELKQNQPCEQNHRFSQIRYGSQVDLIVPLSGSQDFAWTQKPGVHVEAGIDTLLKVTPKTSEAASLFPPERSMR
jgi:phosphatidylserine decarboxylase